MYERENLVAMDIELVGNVASLDPELLQLPEVSPLALKSNPHLADELFSQWLSLPETCRLVFALASFFGVKIYMHLIGFHFAFIGLGPCLLGYSVQCPHLHVVYKFGMISLFPLSRVD